MPNPPTKEFGLRHKFGISFSLQEFETTPADFGTMIPLWIADQAKTEALAQAVQVNRVNDTYEGVVATPNVFMNSRVNMIHVTEYASVAPVADLPDMFYEKAVITWGMGDADVVAPNGTTLLATLFFEKAADTLNPIYNGVNILNGGFLSSEVDGLTGDGELEQVAVSPTSLRAAKDGVLGPKVRSMVQGPFRSRLHKDFPFYRDRWYDSPPAAKRANAFTGCWLYVGTNVAKDETPTAVQNQFAAHFEGELTIDETTTNHHFMIEFNEYNDSFDIAP